MKKDTVWLFVVWISFLTVIILVMLSVAFQPPQFENVFYSQGLGMKWDVDLCVAPGTIIPTGMDWFFLGSLVALIICALCVFYLVGLLDGRSEKASNDEEYPEDDMELEQLEFEKPSYVATTDLHTYDDDEVMPLVSTDHVDHCERCGRYLEDCVCPSKDNLETINQTSSSVTEDQ